MIAFLWEACLPSSLLSEIYIPENYQIIADQKLTYQKANKIVKKWIGTTNASEVYSIIASNFKSIHYIYSSLFPKVYSRINSFGIKNKGNFDLAFTTFKTNKSQLKSNSLFTGKNPLSYVKREEINLNEQKPINTEEKWVLQQKPKPKLPTVRGKAKELKPKNFDEQKKLLKRQLEENTQKMDVIKKAKKNFQRKTIILN